MAAARFVCGGAGPPALAGGAERSGAERPRYRPRHRPATPDPGAGSGTCPYQQLAAPRGRGARHSPPMNPKPQRSLWVQSLGIPVCAAGVFMERRAQWGRPAAGGDSRASAPTWPERVSLSRDREPVGLGRQSWPRTRSCPAPIPVDGAALRARLWMPAREDALVLAVSQGCARHHGCSPVRLCPGGCLPCGHGQLGPECSVPGLARRSRPPRLAERAGQASFVRVT